MSSWIPSSPVSELQDHRDCDRLLMFAVESLRVVWVVELLVVMIAVSVISSHSGLLHIENLLVSFSPVQHWVASVVSSGLVGSCCRDAD